MRDLGAAVKMRQPSKCYRLMPAACHSHKMFASALGLLMMLLISNLNQCVAFNNVHNKNSSHHHHHYHHEKAFDGTANNVLSLVLPHDTYPGYSIKKFTANFTSPDSPYSSLTSYASKPINYRLLETGFSKYFTVLEDGIVMTTSDLSPLVNRPVHLVVLEETPLSTTTHHLQLHIMDRKDMLRFPGAILETVGDVMENLKRGTKVKNVPLLQANSVKPSKEIIYKIMSGNENKAFALQNSKTNEISEEIKVKDTKNVGVWLVTNKPLDRETKSDYNLVIEGSDDERINKVDAKITVHILDDNDNRPIFVEPQYRFIVVGKKSVDADGNSTITYERFTKIGKVQARDADGDKVAYKLTSPSNYVIIVPQTGELVLAGEPDKHELLLEIEAHDLRTPSLTSDQPAKVLIEFSPPEVAAITVQHLVHEEQHAHHRRQRRGATRAIRPAKHIDFEESDGNIEGFNLFRLEKESERETFELREDNPWVMIESHGDVIVKKKWNVEELGTEKTIDFWVVIDKQGHNGEFRFVFKLLIN
jgi:Cadherin domain